MSEIWNRHRQSFLHHLAGDNLSDFLNWSTIVATMFVGDVPYVHREFEEIEGEWRRLDYSDYTLLDTILVEPKVGNPQLLWGWTSGNLIHQLYHLRQWMKGSNRKLADLQTIVEVGAGYGAMALLCRRLGFNGHYYIVDFPELQQIQAYYLDQVAPDYRSLTHWIEAPKDCDLLIACYSLSEVPIPEREKLLSQVDAKEWLFAFSHEFDGVDNQEWFMEFAKNRPEVKWSYYPHAHQENALYMVGIER